MGCSTLYHLAKGGVNDAVLLERNQLTSGTTWHSAAQVRALRSSRNLTELIRYSISLYSQLEQETGQATGWINKGSLSIATSPDRLIHIKRQEALARLFRVRSKAISVEEAKDRWPLMNVEDVIGAVWSPDDGRVSPSDLCAALIKGAKARGGKVYEHTCVKGIVTREGKVIAIETEGGAIRCDAVALCTGLWSRRAAAMAGVNAPVWPCEHFYLLTHSVPGIEGNLPTLSDHDSHLYVRDDSGGLLIGCFEPMGKPISPDALGEDFAFQLLPEDWDHFEPMLLNAMHRIPVLDSVEIKMLLNGPESFTPDGSFMLGESAETRGFFLGCGMNSVGVATGGGAGMALAHCIMDGHTPMDLQEADPKRYPSCFNSVRTLAERAPEILGKHYAIAFPGMQLSSARNLRTLPLHDEWRATGAAFGQYFGWERPLYFEKPGEPRLTFSRPGWFEQVGKEVDRAHLHAAIFDQSTFGKILVQGADVEHFLSRVCANNIVHPPGRIIYTTMLNDRGGIESDLTAFRLHEERYRLYVGTAAIKRDLTWLLRHRSAGERLEFKDETEEYAVLGLMGPEAPRIAEEVGAPELNALAYFQHGEASISGCRVRGARLSYVGEYGWEITCRARDAGLVYAALRDAGAEPCGLYAQTSMRVEKRFLSYGHDIDSDTSPGQAGIGFAVDWSKDFIGRNALRQRREAGETGMIVTILLDNPNAVPIGNEPVYIKGDIVGRTTSAAYGYRVQCPIAIAFLDIHPGQADVSSVQVDVAGELFDGDIVHGAAFDPLGTRMR